jgi:membrane protein implicated in regulation of membrane protease activity
MWHIVIMLPILGIIVFFVLRPGVAVPVYLVILVASGLSYWSLARAMRRRPRTGREGLIGASARVVSRVKPGSNTQYLVRTQGELWGAESPDILEPGEQVTVTSIDGLKLRVQRITGSHGTDRSGQKLPGVR